MGWDHDFSSFAFFFLRGRTTLNVEWSEHYMHMQIQ